jgi:hypothetical protein
MTEFWHTVKSKGPKLNLDRLASDADGLSVLDCGGATSQIHVAHRRIEKVRVYRSYLSASEAAKGPVHTTIIPG